MTDLFSVLGSAAHSSFAAFHKQTTRFVTEDTIGCLCVYVCKHIYDRHSVCIV